jgi:hypothetical protein
VVPAPIIFMVSVKFEIVFEFLVSSYKVGLSLWSNSNVFSYAPEEPSAKDMLNNLLIPIVKF